MTGTPKSLRRVLGRAKFSSFTLEEIRVIAAALEDIESSEGEIRVSRVVELAADPKHPLHPFVYADSPDEAERKWRLACVRKICRAVRIVYIDDVGDVITESPMLVSVQKAAEPGGRMTVNTRRYISVDRAFADPDVRASLLRDALVAAEAWKARYHMLSGVLQSLFDAIEDVRTEYRG